MKKDLNGREQFENALYCALSNDKALDEYDIPRRNVARWNDAVYELKDGENFREKVFVGCDAWVKDYEWHHECESRLCVRLKKKIRAKCLSVDIPNEILCGMRFTFSPWLDKGLEESVRNIIEKTLEKSIGRHLPRLPQRYRRSVLHGALNFRR